jgi:uncharacterized protein (DUF4415 family)
MPENKRAIATDLARLDAHQIQPEEYEDIPELTDEFFEKAEYRIGDRIIRRGRPPLDSPKKQVTLRLDQEVVDHFRRTGPGWQSRINAALRSHIGGK